MTHGAPAALPVAPAPPNTAPVDTPSAGDSLIRSVPIIDVATSGGIAINPFTDIAGDNAIFALIDEAKSTLRLADPALDSLSLSVGGIGIPQHPSTRLVDHLVAAMLRGVDVYLVMSETNWWNGVSAVDTAAQVQSVGNASPAMLCEKFHFSTYRDSAGALVSSHVKLVIVDDQAFYVGSQNLYPGDVSDPVITQLADFGVVVDDADTTQSFITAYWNDAWQAAAPSAVSGHAAPLGCSLAGPALRADCSSGWPSCAQGQTCSWDGPSRGYCCKALWQTQQTCSGEGDGSCPAGTFCSLGRPLISASSGGHAIGDYYCTTADAQPCLP